MASEDTTVKLLSLPKSREVVARFAGMQDLSAFADQPEKLKALCEALLDLDGVPPALDQWSLGTIHNAARLVKAFIDG